MSDLISNVNIFPVNHESLKANVSFTVAEAFVVKAKVRKTAKGLMVSMPAEKGKDKKTGEDKWYDIAFPITAEARAEMNEKVIEAYKAEVGVDGEEPKTKSKKKAPF